MKKKLEISLFLEYSAVKKSFSMEAIIPEKNIYQKKKTSFKKDIPVYWVTWDLTDSLDSTNKEKQYHRDKIIIITISKVPKMTDITLNNSQLISLNSEIHQTTVIKLMIFKSTVQILNVSHWEWPLSYSYKVRNTPTTEFNYTHWGPNNQ